MRKRILVSVFLGGLWAAAAGAQEVERDPIEMRIIATNPSEHKPQDVMVRKTVPVGLSKREDILRPLPAELEIQFDSKTALFYIVAKKRESDQKRMIELGPKEMRIFVVRLNDVWYIEDDDMTGLKEQAEAAMRMLEEGEYKDRARRLEKAIVDGLKSITSFQTDDRIDRETYIAGYLNSKEKLRQARVNVEEMERYIKLQREKASPVLQTDDDVPVQTRAATWLVISIILVFLGILTGAFYFVWQRRAHLLEQPLSEARDAAFPESGAGPGEGEEGT